MSKHLTAVVIPCLDEERTLIATCQSLGFGGGQRPPSEAALILVDNGSKDSTLEVARSIQKPFPESVIITTEPERGYVPPRRRGNHVAIEEAVRRGVPKENLLIIQADADTIYSDGYVETIQVSAQKMGCGVMIESRCEPQEDFVANYQDYISLCNEVDAEFESVLSNPGQDVIIDDKACAYWASDYELWGGHQREYTSQRDEIYSETTRLYIRARTYGATRYLCEEAVAKHSARRNISEPDYSFATAGFPRERSFQDRWSQHYRGPHEIIKFCSQANRAEIALAQVSRRAHQQGLFQMLTSHVQVTLGSGRPNLKRTPSRSFDLPKRNVRTARDSPGILLEDVFEKIDHLIFDAR